jgi:AraC-like DNA-binding protein
LIAERHAEPDLDPADIAGAMGISKRYLHNLLAADGATFLGVLRSVRIESARALLADPRFDGRQIAEIAWQCGYVDPSYFARVFRKQFGMGPREWRAARRG